jgi:cell division septal protein FtsQ
MDRSLAGRSPIALPLPRLGGVAGSLREVWRLVGAHRRVRVAVLAALAATPLLVGGWMWLRQSPFVSVEHVQISGVHGPQAAAIDAALTGAARRMSTLDVNSGALRAATAQFVVVREVRAAPRFPHGLSIHVVEQLPVAALVVGGARTAVAGDGVILGPELLSSSLPTVAGYHEGLSGQRVQGPNVLAAVTVLGAAPMPLRRAVARVYTGPDGLTIAFRNGLLAYFGDATLRHAKWISLARVLADSSSQGSSYVDVRLPARPAAGFPAGVAPPSAAVGASASETPVAGESASASEATISSLAASLAGHAGGSAASTTSATETPAATAETTRESQSEAQSESPSTTTTEPSQSSEPTGG